MKKTRFTIRKFVTAHSADANALPRARAWGLKVKPLYPGRLTSRQRKAAAAAQTIQSLDIDLSKADSRVDLRHDESSNTLRGVAAPTLTAIAPAAADVPGGLVRLPDGRECHIVYSDGSLTAIVDFQPSVITTLDAAPRFVLPTDGGASLLVMPATGSPRLFHCDPSDGSWSSGTLFPDLPAITLVKNDLDTCSVDIPAFTLADTYGSTSRQLSDRDVASVTSRLADAYATLAGHATARGLFFQPVLARYRLRGADGRVVYTSAPIVVSPDKGLQATLSTLTLSGDGMRAATFTPLHATLFSVGHTFASPLPEQWSRLLRGVEILVTPQLHPFSAALPSQTLFTSSSATRLTFTASTPGADSAGKSTLPASAAVALIDHDEDSALWLPQSIRPAYSLERELSIVAALLSKAVTSPTDSDMLLRRLSPPHSFTAGCGARNGDLIAWANLKVLPFEGYSPAEMVIGRAHSLWESVPMAAAVTLDDGSVQVNALTATNTEIASISPLLVYPLPHATDLTLVIGKKKVSVKLRPSPSGRFAYWLSPDLAPLTPDDSLPSFLMPAASPRAVDLPGAVLLASAEAPLEPMAASCGDESEISALFAVEKSAHSFSWAEPHFYALGAGGVFSIAPASGRTDLRATRIDSRPLLAPDLATAIPGGIAAVLARRIVTFIGSRHTDLPGLCDASSLAWCQLHNELWAASLDGSQALVSDLSGSSRWTHTLPAAGSRILSAGAIGRIISPSGQVYDLNGELSSSMARVQLSASLPCTLPPGSVATMRLPLFGARLTGSVSLSASHDADAPSAAEATLFRLAFPSPGSSPLHPIAESFIVPHCHHLTLRLDITGAGITIPTS